MDTAYSGLQEGIVRSRYIHSLFFNCRQLSHSRCGQTFNLLIDPHTTPIVRRQLNTTPRQFHWDRIKFEILPFADRVVRQCRILHEHLNCRAVQSIEPIRRCIDHVPGSISCWAVSMQGFRKDVVNALASSHDMVVGKPQPGGYGGEGRVEPLCATDIVEIRLDDTTQASVGAGDIFFLVSYLASARWGESTPMMPQKVSWSSRCM